ncbi:zinc finger protein 836 isoform X7 [Cryptotermes secundus]|uniref:zinc finger protein 836 isoform X7 n=1 Tax=Cryptotermes secundus TaxID=105785 RepID=UPI000CD7DE0D|nr:zinc finger protein 836 isoform X7 [Cryptotermes secundus]
MSSLNYMELCRLCLVKERVSIPIFEGEGNVRQIFLKIASCLPVKVARDDKLPKKICSDCMYKLDNAYQFWNTTANAEKQLLQWLGEIASDDKKSVPSNTIETEQLVLKEEAVEQDQGSELAKGLSRVEAVLADDCKGGSEDEDESESEDEGSNSEDSGEDDGGEAPSKEEAESDEEPYGPLEPTTFVNVSLAGCDEAGPSGMQQQQQEQQQQEQQHHQQEQQQGPQQSQSLQQVQQSSQSQFLTPGAPSTSTAAPTSASGSSRSFLWILDPTSAAAIAISSMCSIGSTLAAIVGDESPNTETPAVSPMQMDSNALAKATLGLPLSPLRSLGLVSKSVELDPTHTVTSNVALNSAELSLSNSQLKQTVSKCLAYDSAPTKQISEGSSRNADYSGSDTQHITSVAKAEDLRCTVCGRICKNKARLEYHFLSQHTPKKYHCTVCNKAFWQQGLLKKHSVTHSTKRPFECDICHKTYKRSFQLTEHKKRHSAPKDFVCDTCGYATINRLKLEMHMKRHFQEYQFTCEICGKGYHAKSELKGHIELHSGEKHQCEICGKEFHGRANLRIHQQIHDPDRNTQRFPCDICGKAFQYKFMLEVHMKSHAGEPNYICEICGKAISSRNSLKVHRRIHTGEKPFVCEICSKAFRSRNYMRDHMRSHTGEKPHKCNECGKSFTQRSTLVIHMRYHTGQRPYKCQHCGKGFVTKTLMTAHQKSH